MATQDHDTSIASVATDITVFPQKIGENERETKRLVETIAMVEEGDDHNLSRPKKRPMHSSTNAPVPMTSNESPKSSIGTPPQMAVSTVMKKIESLLVVSLLKLRMMPNFRI